MALFSEVVEALVASREWDQATLSRLAFWTDALGEKDLVAITPDDVDLALVKLAKPIAVARVLDTRWERWSPTSPWPVTRGCAWARCSWHAGKTWTS